MNMYHTLMNMLWMNIKHLIQKCIDYFSIPFIMDLCALIQEAHPSPSLKKYVGLDLIDRKVESSHLLFCLLEK